MIASACSTGLIKKFGQFDSPVVMSGWQFMLGGAVMAVCGFAAGGRLGSENPMAYVVLLYLALLSAVAYSIWAVLLRANPVSRVAVYTFLQPIFGVILSLLLVDRNSDAPLLRYAVAPGAHLREHCGGEPRAEDGGDGETLRLCLKFRQEPEVSALPIG